MDVKGGAASVMERTAGALRELGVTVDITYETRPDATGYDLVHAWNVWAPGTALEQLEHLRAQDATIVWQPFFLDLSEFTWARAAIQDVLRPGRSEVEYERLLGLLATGELEIDGLSQGSLNEPEPGFHAALGRMLALVDHVCACSIREAQTLAQRTSAAEFAWTHVPHGVDRSEIAAASPEPFAERFGVRDYVLCLGAVDARKNQLMLCEALRGTGLPLVLAGPAFEPAYLDSCLRRGEHVIHTGRLERDLVASALAGAAVHALPSFAEGSALASMEAAAAGVPVVVSNRASEFEYYGDTAFFCDPADVHSIRAAVLRAHGPHGRDPSRLAALADRMAAFTWERSARTTLQAYARALAERPARARRDCGLDGARDRVVVAFADEVLAAPDLLAGYARDDVGGSTLVLRGDLFTGEHAERLEQAIATAGLDTPDVDVLALGGLTADQDAALASQTAAVLTRTTPPGPFARVPVLGA